MSKPKVDWEYKAEEYKRVLESYKRLYEDARKNPITITEKDFEDIRKGDYIIVTRDCKLYLFGSYRELAKVEKVGTTWLHNHRYLQLNWLGERYYHDKQKGKVRVVTVK